MTLALLIRAGVRGAAIGRRLMAALLLALFVAGCATHGGTNPDAGGRTWTTLDSCLLRAQAVAEGAPRLVTSAELERVCRGEAP